MKSTNVTAKQTDRQTDRLTWAQLLLVDGVLDTLALRSESLSLLPTHLLQHLVSHVLTSQLELLVVGVIRLAAFFQRLQQTTNVS